MNIAGILHRHADDFPDEIAMVDQVGRRRRRTSYAQLDRSVQQMAVRLRQSGLEPGDTVLLFHPMSVELYASLAAILYNGMTAMFVDPSVGRGYIDRCCELVPPKAMIASSKAHLLRILSPAIRRIPFKWSIGGYVPFTNSIERPVDDRGKLSIETCDVDTPALVSFTSGSTGEPKPTVRTHGFLLAQHRAIEQSLCLRAGERELVTLPIFVLANLASRVTSVIADADLRRPAQIDAAPVVRQIQDNRTDRATASPAFFERLIDHCERNGEQLCSLRRVFTGGGPVAPGLLDRLQTVAPNADITVVYGATEAEPISTISTKEMDRDDIAAISNGKGLLVGTPLESIDVQIMRDVWGQSIKPLTKPEFQRSCQSIGEVGEIVVAGPHVLDGYVVERSDYENKFWVDQTRWHRTGDAGYFDERGRLWLLGRCAARVNDDRGEIYPLGVEQAAMRHPCIGQAAMVSHRNQRMLVVTLRDLNDRPDLGSLLKSLAFASVDSIRIVKRIPLDHRHNSKIDYRQLHEILDR